MNQGAFDFTTKPINLEDLERTIEKAAEQIAFIHEANTEVRKKELLLPRSAPQVRVLLGSTARWALAPMCRIAL